MKIVIATDLYFPSVGGVEVETKRIATELSELGHEIYILAPFYKNYIDSEKKGLKVIRIKPQKRLFDPFYLIRRQVFKELDRLNPDVIHIQSSLAIARAASNYSRKRQIPCVATGHYANGELDYKFKKVKPIVWLIRYFVDKFQKAVWSKSDLVTFPSKYAGRLYKKIINEPEKLITLANGINKPNCTSKTIQQSAQKTIIYVGRLEPYKNVTTIIKALPLILSKIDTRLLIVGEGQSESDLKEEVKSLGLSDKVTFTGFASGKRIEDMYSKSDIFVIASATDNQPLVLLEALSAGLPVVASNVGGIPEIIKDGRNGYLFEPFEPTALSEKVIKILSDKSLYTKMRNENLNMAKNYDIKEIIFKILNLYQRAIAISSVRNSSYQARPAYLTKSFALKFALFVFVLAVFTRNVLASPATAKARGTIIKDKILNLKVVKKIENIDLKLKDTFVKEGKRQAGQ